MKYIKQLPLLYSRPVAYAIDFVILWCVCLLPQIIAYYALDGIPFKYFNKPFHIYAWVGITVSLPIWLYFIFQEKSSKRSTIGKRVFNLEVTNISGNPISGWQSIKRTFVRLIPWELAHIGLLPIYFSPKPEPGIGLYLSNIIILIYVVFFLYNKGDLTVHDILSRSKVEKVQELHAT